MFGEPRARIKDPVQRRESEKHSLELESQSAQQCKEEFLCISPINNNSEIILGKSFKSHVVGITNCVLGGL
jgi:hypothetical protein